MINYKIKHQELRHEIIDRLLSIKERPEGWLPHVVYVQDENIDYAASNAKLYNQYQLLEFSDSGECQLLDIRTNRVETGELNQIETDGLITILNWYGELTGNHIHADNSKELRVFVFPADLGRNITDGELLNFWQDNENNITSYLPCGFAALLNDEMFDEHNNYVRFINI